MKNLRSCKGHDSADNVLILNLLDWHRREALEWLYAMGMSRDALSPGLDGFARSLADFHPVAHREQQK